MVRFLQFKQTNNYSINIPVQEMSSDERLKDVFNKAVLNKTHNLNKLPRTLNEHVGFMEHNIRKQLKSFTLLSICGGEKGANYKANSYFDAAFNAMTLEERVQYFDRTVKNIHKAQLDRQKNQTISESERLEKVQGKYGSNVQMSIQINTGFRSWEDEMITVNGFKVVSNKKINIDLRNYLIRKSKKKEIVCYVLEAIRSSKPQTIRFAIKSKDEEERHIDMITELINCAYETFLSRETMAGESATIIKKSNKSGTLKENLDQVPHIVLKKDASNPVKLEGLEIPPVEMKKTMSVSFELMKSKDDQMIDEDLKDLIDQFNAEEEENDLQMESNLQTGSIDLIAQPKTDYKNVFSTMMSNSILDHLHSLQGYEPSYSDSARGLFIYKNSEKTFKMELTCRLPARTVLMGLYNVELYKFWHPEVNESQQKFRISSQNCSIFYQKHNPYSKWYRQRDYLYLKHLFELKGSYYLADKSFQNTNFIPFSSIQRGKIKHCLTKVQEKGPEEAKITMEFAVEHGGVLKQAHCDQITINYLKGFLHLEEYFGREEFRGRLLQLFRHEWNVQQTIDEGGKGQHYAQYNGVSSENQFRTCDFEEGSQISKEQEEESEMYFSVMDSDDEADAKEANKQSAQDIIDREIGEEELAEKQHLLELRRVNKAQMQLDENGRIIKPQKYLSVRHPTVPFEKGEPKIVERKHENFVLADNWRHMQTGGLEMCNQKKILAQNSVFSFIVKKLKENLLSGKGLSNISLPVQVFNCDSNLSRVCLGFSLAPKFLEAASALTDPSERMKLSILFGISSSLFYLDAEKPFNPILGETYQGFIDGCPVYAEQISHHPPITAYYMIGRGYKIYGSIEAKVNLHFNSADGLNEGFTFIEFDDGQVIQFNTPAGQVSNTTMGGDRQFNFLGKGYWFDRKNQLYVELKFQEETGWMSKSTWKYRDQVEAQILTVKQSYMDKIDNKVKDGKSPAAKDIESHGDKLDGRWLFEVEWEGEKHYKYGQNEDLPYELMHYEYPLNSDLFYREDIYYRILEDLARSQIEKERLEVLQRGDRKFRQKYHGKTKH